MTEPTQPHIALPTPGFGQRRARALIGWLPINEGALWLAGRQMSDQPNPEHIAACQAARQVVAAREPGLDQTGMFSDLPPEVEAHVEVLRQDARSAQILAESGDPKIVDLTRVCAAQPQILIEDALKRLEGVAADNAVALASITLPLQVPERIPVTFDQTKNAWILSSPDPNLRVAGNFNAQVGPGLQGFGFIVTLQKSYLQVAGLGGRYFLRDGYHRAYGLLAAGIRYVPALVKNFESFEEVRLPQGLLPQGAFLGDRPPLLPDYLNDQVAADTNIPIVQKMVVVQALELHSLG